MIKRSCAARGRGVEELALLLRCESGPSGRSSFIGQSGNSNKGTVGAREGVRRWHAAERACGGFRPLAP